MKKIADATDAPYAFLFDADFEGAGGCYGHYFDKCLLHALSTADPNGVTVTRLTRGDVLFWKLGERTTAISQKKNALSRTSSYDRDVYRTVVWDFLDAL